MGALILKTPGSCRAPGLVHCVLTFRAVSLSVMVASVAAAAEPPSSLVPVTSIYWSDGDSGKLNGEGFRLANVDAPETGRVGASGGAKCESERNWAYEAKSFMVRLTRNATLRVSNYYGTDRYGRHVLELTVDGERLSQQGLASRHLAPWPHEEQRALAAKPRWCR